MRNVIVALVVINTVLLLTNLFVHVGYARTEDVTVEGVPSLEILPDKPGEKYSAETALGTSSCFTIGPYFSEKAAQLLAGNIRNFGLAVTIRSMNSKDTLNYLVYIANIDSFEKAKQITEDLSKQNVGKFNIVKKGPYENTITFGFYKNLDKAKRKTEYIRYLGYDAKYNGQKVTRKVYWVDYDEPIGTATPVLTWSKSIDSSSNAQIIPRTCDQQAWYGSGAFANSSYDNLGMDNK